jgi:hypothetical protein
MIVYSGTKEKFRHDIMTNVRDTIIYNAFKAATGHSTGQSEITSWRNSLQFMDRIVGDNDIPSDVGVSIEYHIPQSSKRIDFILSGKGHDHVDTAILIELKQWQAANLTSKDGVVSTRFAHG